MLYATVAYISAGVAILNWTHEHSSTKHKLVCIRRIFQAESKYGHELMENFVPSSLLLRCRPIVTKA